MNAQTLNNNRDTFDRISGIIGYEIDDDLWNVWANALTTARYACKELGVYASCDTFGTPSDALINHTIENIRFALKYKSIDIVARRFFAKFGIVV